MAEERFALVLADPPWNEQGSGKIVRGAQKHYPLMKTNDIIGLGSTLEPHLADDAFLFLWATVSHLPDALSVMGAWGFTYKTNAVWCKPRIGLGHYLRMQHDHLLIGTRGSPPYSKRPNGSEAGRVVMPSVIHAPTGAHSEKPQAVHDYCGTFSDGPYLEMFARKPRMGWASWGDEVGVCLTT